MKVKGWFICEALGEVIATLPGYAWAYVQKTTDNHDVVVKHCSGESEAAIPIEVVEALLDAERDRTPRP